MPNAIPAAGEAMPEVTLEAMIERYLAAKEAMDAGKAPQGSTEEAEFHAALEALQETDAKPSTLDGAMQALRLAASEVHAFDGPEMVPNLLDGVLAILETSKTEHPWTKARRLMKELSATLADCDSAKWSAHVMPPIPPSFNGFASFPMRETRDELPVDHVERLSWELSEALSRYQNGAYTAVVLPSVSAGHTVMFTKLAAFDRRASA